jgi:hypothetical protein
VWLTGHLPDGGEAYRRPSWDWQEAEAVIDEFFASTAVRRFAGSGYREVLDAVLETGSGDPLRWSAARIRHALAGASYDDDGIPLEVQINAPELLRAYVPFAHARSGIREELTDEALAAIDNLAPAYHEELIESARDHGDLFGEEVV